MNELLMRRCLLLSGLTAPLLTGCLWPRFFDIGWEEEVQLHDKRLESLAFDRFGKVIFRKTEFSFDAGPGIGQFKKTILICRFALTGGDDMQAMATRVAGTRVGRCNQTGAFR